VGRSDTGDVCIKRKKKTIGKKLTKKEDFDKINVGSIVKTMTHRTQINGKKWGRQEDNRPERKQQSSKG